MGPMSAGFVKLCIAVLGLFTFIFNITFLVTIFKTRSTVTKYTFFKFIETRILDVPIEKTTRCSDHNGLSQHMWLDVCSSSVDVLCNIPLFPKAPNRRSIINGTEFSWPGNEKFAQRIFGFLRPPKTGSYVFAISSDDSSELWLSSDEKSENSVLIANVGDKREMFWTSKYDYWKYSTQISSEIELVADKKYFIEILHVQSRADNHLVVQWKHSVSVNFSGIAVEYLSPYLTEDLDIDNFSYDVLIPEAKSCKNLTKENPFLLQSHLTYAEHNEFGQVLPNFDLQDKKRDLTRTLNTSYKSLFKHSPRTEIYPYEKKNKNVYSRWLEELPWNCQGLDQEDAMFIVKSFVDKLNASHNGTYSLKSLVNIEKTNFMNGSRYLLELDLLKKPNNDTTHLSEYIYQDKTNLNQLYYVDHIQWKRNALITFVITAKNQGTWIQIFLHDVATLMRQTSDTNVNVVVFDYESQDIDLQKAVLASGISHRVKTVSKAGRYSRRESFNMAIELVDDPHSIVFLVDLHLTFGEALLNDIRKHTIEGHLVYTPTIIRQFDCSTPNTKYAGYYGYYERQGFGIVAMYKSDWDRVGGFTMNDQNKHKWGGEDYDLMDSVYLHGLDYVRVKCPYVYHYAHIRKGMWS